jgi:hypothetical protein
MTLIARESPLGRQALAPSRPIIASYDISAECSLRCDGCFYFDSPDSERALDTRSQQDWEHFFEAERDRGVNFAMISGAEPSLRVDRIRLAQRYIPYGLVYTNGARWLPEDIRYRIHISTWGTGATDTGLRGGDAFAKALRDYAGDRRAVCVFTISARNLDHIVPATSMARDHGLPITFSYYSPTAGAIRGSRDGAPSSAAPSRGDFERARREIDQAIALFPETVVYSLHYDEWVTREDLHRIDPETGIARDCAIRLSRQRNYAVDLSPLAKCIAPQVECATCRGYSPSYGTYLRDRRKAATGAGGIDARREVRRIWARLYLPEEFSAEICGTSGPEF